MDEKYVDEWMGDLSNVQLGLYKCASEGNTPSRI